MAQAIRSALAAAFFALMAAPATADVPILNVEQACRDSASADPTIPFNIPLCLDSENRARQELTGKWTSFPEADRRECTEMATMGGTASYVELITCLEMDRDAREERAKTPLNMRKPVGMRKKQ